MTPTLAILFLGVVCAAIGGELFVKGSVGLAATLRVPAAIIGATVAAFATSSPEIAVAVISSVAGKPQIALGDALGSNIANIGLVLGLGALISAIPVGKASFGRDIRYALFAPVLTVILAWDGRIERWEGLALLALFALWLTLTIADAKRSRGESDGVDAINVPKAVGLLVIGLALLVTSGQLVVISATQIAQALGLSTVAIAATVVAAGTSMPELATTVMAKIRGHDDVAIGTLLGSNVFNNLFIVGLAATLHPMSAIAIRDVMLASMFGVALVVIMAAESRRGRICRVTGGVLLGFYVAFVALSFTLAK